MTLLLFDFDGTIADTYPIFLEVLRENYQELGLDRSVIDCNFKELTAFQILNKLGISYRKIPKFIRLARERIHLKMDNAKPIDGICDALIDLRKMNLYMAMITTNSYESVIPFLKRNKIDFFDDVKIENRLFGKHRIIKKYIKNRNVYSPATTFYIGDEARDIIASKKAKVSSIAVTWGFNSKALLLKEKPDFVIDKPSQLLNFPKK